MTEDTSIRIMTLEFYLLVIPVILIFLALAWLGLQIDDDPAVAISAVLIFCSLVFMSYLIIQFIVDGRFALRKLSAWMFLFPIVGAIMACSSIIILIFQVKVDEMGILFRILGYGIGGIPLLLPFTHLMIEYYVSKNEY